jgi:hypothetical protein
MHRFWDTYTSNILQEIKAKKIVEVGAFTGLNTKNIVKFCEDNSATCDIVDVVEIKNYAEISDHLNKAGKFHKSSSLDILHRLPADAYLLDGDHNWYTLFNELNIIFDNFLESQPTILFHDVAWPYHRRDMYSNPDEIPEEYKHPHKKSGLYPGNPGLDDLRGINANFENATQEGGEKNGVLTAIEDIIKKYHLANNYTFFSIPVFNGFGALVPKNKYPDSSYSRIKKLFEIPKSYLELTERVEIDRMKALAEICKLEGDIKAVQKDCRELFSRIQKLSDTKNIRSKGKWGFIKRILGGQQH